MTSCGAFCTLSEMRWGDILSIGFAENRFLKDAGELSWVKKPQELPHFLGKRGKREATVRKKVCREERGAHDESRLCLCNTSRRIDLFFGSRPSSPWQHGQGKEEMCFWVAESPKGGMRGKHRRRLKSRKKTCARGKPGKIRFLFSQI